MFNHNTVPHFGFLLFLGLLVQFTAPECAGQQPAVQPGELFKVTLSIPDKDGDQTVIFNFHYCPQGTIRKTQPRSSIEPGGALAALKNSKVENFYMLEHEVSIRQFATVVGKEAFDTKLKEIDALAVGDQKEAYQEILDAFKNRSPVHPIPCIWLDDALLLCSTLELEARKQLLQPTSIESWIFRLPTIHEWRYSALARTDVTKQSDSDLYIAWPRLNDLRKSTSQTGLTIFNDYNSAKYSLGTNGLPSMPTQRELEDLLTSKADSESLSEERTNFLFAIMNLVAYEKEAAHDFELPLAAGFREIMKSRENAWGIFDLHTGLTEIVLATSSIKRTEDFWLTFKECEFTADLPEQTQSKIKVGLAGISHNYHFTKDKIVGPEQQWKRFTVWGGMTWDKLANEFAPKPIYELDENAEEDAEEDSKNRTRNDFVENYNAGMRIILRKSIRINWFALIREQAFAKTTMAAQVRKIFADHTDVAERLSLADELTPKLKAIAFYQGVAHYRTGNVPAAVTSFDRAQSTRPKVPKPDVNSDNDLFYSLIKDLSQQDPELK